MNTADLIAAASRISGPMAAQSFSNRQMDSTRISEIARAAVQLAMEIEKEARKALSGS